MSIKNKFLIIFILFLFLSTINLFGADNNGFISLKSVISLLNLEVYNDYVIGKTTLKKLNKSVVLLIDSPYILIEKKQYFINSYILIENGQIFISQELENLLNNYFTNKNYEKKINKVIMVETGKKDFYLDLKRDNKYSADNKNLKKDLDLTNDIILSNVEEIEDIECKEEKINIKNKYIYVGQEPSDIKINAIIIDPGHGGEDPGAIGYSKTKEKDIVLKTSLILYDKLKKEYPDKKIVLTRYNDVFISLDKRAKIANYVFNKYGNSLFISIHVNASRSSRSYGFETWYLVEEYRRNIISKGEISQDVDVENVLNSMLNDEIYKESQDLANKIQKNLNKEIGSVSEDRGIKEQTYFVIKKSIMPAVLVEIGFNTNKYEEIRLTRYSYLNKITDGILKGVLDFIKDYEKTYGYTK